MSTTAPEAPSTTSAAAPATDSSPRASSRTARRLIVLLIFLIALMFLGYNAGWFKPRPKVALVTASQGAYWDLIIKGAQHAAERHKVSLTVIKSKGDEPSQTQAIRDLVGKGFDGVAISPNDPPRQAAALAEIAADADNLITFDSDSNVSRRLCFIGTDNYDAGRMAGKEIRSAVPDGGEIILCIGSLDKENGQRRRQGVIDELMERSFERNREMDPVDAPIKTDRSKYTVVATLVDGIDQARAQQMARDALAKYPNVKCFAGLFAYSTPAILGALKDAGKLGKVQVVGFDTYEDTLSGVESGSVAATIVQDPYNIGYESVRVLADAARGDRHALPLFQQFYLACDTVKKDNLAQTRADLARKIKGGSQFPAQASTAAPAPTPTTQQATTQAAAAQAAP